MSAIITKKVRIETAKEHISRYFTSSAGNTSYFFTGKNIPWSDESSPDVCAASDKQWDDVLRQRIFFKRIEESDTNLAIKRFDWEINKIYHGAEYNDDYCDYRNWNTAYEPFYVHNSEGNIYKCISNNNDTPSTVEPTGTSLGYINLGDGYIWKFMLSLSTVIEDKFLCDNWIPIPYRVAEKTTDQINVEGAAVIGDIVSISVSNPGENYSVTPTIQIRGNGSGCVASAVMDGETIKSIIVSNPGSGYDFASVHIFGNGNGAEGVALISPRGGHGSDSVDELGAYYVIVSKKIIGNEGGIAPVTGTYRNAGIVKNTLNKSAAIITTERFNTFSDININNCSGSFNTAERVIGEDSLAEGYVYTDPGGVSKIVTMYMIEGTFIDGEDIYGQDSGIFGEYVDTGSTYTDVDIWSGDLLYFENNMFITRRLIQTEQFVMSIEF